MPGRHPRLRVHDREGIEWRRFSMAQKKIDGITLPEPGKYELDKAHTAVEFVARHILTKVRGRFTGFEGAITIHDDPSRS
jgi:hypothetical protein